MADRYLVEAQRHLEDGEYRSALAALDKILELEAEEDLDIPDIFWIRHAQAALAAGFPQRAIVSASKYLEVVGQEGSEYQTALELLVDAEEEAVRMAQEEVARQAREARARQEAARRAEEARQEEARRAEEARRRAALARQEEARRAEEARQRAALARQEEARRAAESARLRIGQGKKGVVGGILWGSAGGALFYFAEDLADVISEDDPENRDNVVLGAELVAVGLGLLGTVSLVRGISNWGNGAKALREAEERLGQANIDWALSVGGKGEIGLVFAWRY